MNDCIKKNTHLNAPIDKVWQALADYQEFGSWFRVKISTPFVPGQSSQGHMTYPGYEHIRWEAIIQKMEKPTLFCYSWHPYAIDPAIDYSDEAPTLVEFHLSPSEGGTQLAIIETGFAALPEGRREEAYDMHDKGWEEQMRNIRSHVEE